jgi:deoxyribose-phosphate aldolase
MPDIAKIVSTVMKERVLMRSMCAGSGCQLPDDAVVHDRPVVDAMVTHGAERITAGPGITTLNGFDRALARMIDHTMLKPEATEHDIRTLCEEARTYGFASVCVNPSWVPLCAQLLGGSPVKVCTVVGFPLGSADTETKVFEAERARAAGATEFDMVINVGRLKSGDRAWVEHDIKSVVRAVKKHDHRNIVKVIIETCLLTDEEKIVACLIARESGADYVKTSTGFAAAGATAGDVALMRFVVGSAFGVKASGGIRSIEDARAMAASGADRIGASASVRIVNH